MSETTTVGRDFPLCADPARDELVRPLVERSLAFLVDEVGTARLNSVILTGSLARGEGSFLVRPSGFRVLGWDVIVRGQLASQS